MSNTTRALFDPRRKNVLWPEPNDDPNIPYNWGMSGYIRKNASDGSAVRLMRASDVGTVEESVSFESIDAAITLLENEIASMEDVPPTYRAPLLAHIMTQAESLEADLLAIPEGARRDRSTRRSLALRLRRLGEIVSEFPTEEDSADVSVGSGMDDDDTWIVEELEVESEEAPVGHEDEGREALSEEEPAPTPTARPPLPAAAMIGFGAMGLLAVYGFSTAFRGGASIGESLRTGLISSTGIGLLVSKDLN